MKNIYTPINAIGGIAIREITLYCRSEYLFPDELTASYICSATSIPSIVYYIQKDNGQYAGENKNSWNVTYFYDECLEIDVTWNEAINYLIYHEWHMRRLESRDVPYQRTMKGRFAEGNKYAYNATIPLKLIAALYKMEMPITQIAKLFHVSRNTIYARIAEYKKR